MTTHETPLSLDGAVALVTGATRGLGRAITEKLCAAGCDTYLNYAQNESDAHRAVAELKGLPGKAVALQGDVSEPGVLADLADAVVERSGRLTVLVHNAATFHPMSAGEPRSAEVHKDIAVAIDPLLSAANRLARVMRDGGRIIAVSSTGARRVVPRYLGPGLAKAALENLVRYLAVEFAPIGITVNAVSTAKLDKGHPAEVNGEMTRLLAERTPGGRLTRPEDVAGVVALLCRSEASWIQGQVITVDGGLGLLG